MRRLLCTVLLLPLLTAAPAAAAPWERQNESISCADDTGSAPFYNGASASTTYDATFRLGHDIPAAMLNGYIPQGLGTWPGWGGAGRDLLIQTAYNDGGSVVLGLVPGGGATQMPRLLLPDGSSAVSHVGGVAVVGRWMYVTGPRSKTILRFPLRAVRARLADGKDLRARAEIPLRIPGFSASFLAAEGSTLWVGMHDPDSRNRMYPLQVGSRGGLKVQLRTWRQIPKKTQGLAVTRTHFLYSTSYGSKNRSNVYVVRRGYTFLDRAHSQDLVCFAAPSMSQGFTVSGGQAFLSFESGSFKYRADPCDKPVFEGDCTRNVITHLHRAPLDRLLAMT